MMSFSLLFLAFVGTLVSALIIPQPPSCMNADGSPVKLARPLIDRVDNKLSCSHGCKVAVDNVVRDISVECYGNNEVRAAIVPDYGNCSRNHEGYRVYVHWGDGNTSIFHLIELEPYQGFHQYSESGCYTVTLAYCSVTDGCDTCIKYSYPVNVFVSPSTSNAESDQNQRVIQRFRNLSKNSLAQPRRIENSEFFERINKGGCGCKVSVDKKKRDVVIEAVSGYRTNTAIAPNYGTCSHAHRGYAAVVAWGDGEYSISEFQELSPFQSLHQYYPVEFDYNVTLAYCSITDFTCENCLVFNKEIHVCADPPTPEE